MPVRFDDLPPALRRAVLAADDGGAPCGGEPARVDARYARGRPRPRYRCARCGALVTSWAPAERHADTHGGARLDLVLEPLEGSR